MNLIVGSARAAALAAFVACVAVPGAARAQPPAPAPAPATPAGLWRTIDDDGHTEKSLVRIVERDGVYSGKVEKIADASKAGEKCAPCQGALKDQPIQGMTLLTGVRQDADDATLFEGGEIVDPGNGKSYKVRLRPVDGGRKLEVRGYIGIPALGRTQTWLRAE